MKIGKSDEDWGQWTKTDGRLTNKWWKNSEKYEKAMKIEDNFLFIVPNLHRFFLFFIIFHFMFILCKIQYSVILCVILQWPIQWHNDTKNYNDTYSVILCKIQYNTVPILTYVNAES